MTDPQTPATEAGRALLGPHDGQAPRGRVLCLAILRIEAEARADEREYQAAVRKDWGTMPHGEFRQKYGGLDRALYLLPANCSCRECQMWSS